MFPDLGGDCSPLDSGKSSLADGILKFSKYPIQSTDRIAFAIAVFFCVSVPASAGVPPQQQQGGCPPSYARLTEHLSKAAPGAALPADLATLGGEGFAKLLREGRFEDAQRLLEPEIIKANQTLSSLPHHEKMAIRSQWAGLQTGRAISTDFGSLLDVSEFMNFKPGEALIDIGSGHGNPGLAFGSLQPGLRVTGYDFVKAKVDGSNWVAQQLGLTNVRFVQQDLSDPSFKLPAADYYYFFNPLTPKLTNRIAEAIKEMSRDRQIRVIVEDTYSESGRFEGSWAPAIFAKLGFTPVARIENRHGTMPMTVFQFGAKGPMSAPKLPPLPIAKILHWKDGFEHRQVLQHAMEDWFWGVQRDFELRDFIKAPEADEKSSLDRIVFGMRAKIKRLENEHLGSLAPDAPKKVAEQGRAAFYKAKKEMEAPLAAALLLRAMKKAPLETLAPQALIDLLEDWSRSGVVPGIAVEATRERLRPLLNELRSNTMLKERNSK